MFYLSNHKASTTAGAKVIKNWIALDPPTSIVILIRFLYAAPSYFSLKQSPPCKLTLPAVGKENSNFFDQSTTVFYVAGLSPSNTPFTYLKSAWYRPLAWTGTTFIFSVCLSKHINKRKFPSEIICKMLCLYFERNLAWPELKIVYAHKLKFINKPYGILLPENSIASLYSRPGKDTRILIKRIFGTLLSSENKLRWHHI